MVYKKDLTPFSPGGSIVKHVGKGGVQATTPLGHAALTRGSPFAGNSYPKPAPPAPMPAPAPAMGGPMEPDADDMM